MSTTRVGLRHDVNSQDSHLVTLRMPPASRRALSAVVASSGTALAAAVVAFVVNILMARLLGPGPRGEIAFVLQGAYVIAPLLAVGVDRQALREPRRTAAISERHVWILGGLGMAVALAWGSLPVVACLATAAVGASMAIERGIGMATGSLGRFITVQVGIQIWILAASTTLFISDVKEPLWWLGVYAAPAPVVLFLSFRRRSAPRSGGSIRHSLLGTVDHRSVTYMVGGFGILMAARVERLILPLLASTEELGLYVAIATASEMLVWAAGGLGESRVVGFLSGPLTRADLAKAALRDFAYFLVMAAPLAAGIHFLLLPLLGREFAQADVLIIPLCLAAAAWATYLQMSAVWLARGSMSQSIRLDVGAAALTAACVTALIPQFGALGAALGCIAAYLTMTPMAIAFLPKLEDAEAPVEQ
jgi:O-antigen/teichoic acid export membrane protein